MALARTTKPPTHSPTYKIYVLTVIRWPLVLGLSYLFVRLPVADKQDRSAHFLVPQRKKSEHISRPANKVLYVTEGSKCWDLTTGSTDNVPELERSNEEADMRMILKAKHANAPVVIDTDDTDGMVLLLTHSDLLGTVYMRTGRGSKSRIIPLALIKEKLLKQISPGITVHDF